MKGGLYMTIFLLVVLLVGGAIVYNAKTIDDIESETVKIEESDQLKNSAHKSKEKTVAIGKIEIINGHEIQEVVKIDANWNKIKEVYDSYGSSDGKPGTVRINTKDWQVEKNELADISFSYPSNAKLISEDGCYRIEYNKGFVILIIPTAKVNEDSDARCGARTGVGDLPESAKFNEFLTIKNKQYKFSGFSSVFESATEYGDGHKEFKIGYDFHYMSPEMNLYCDDLSCLRIGYGIYAWDLDEKINKEELDETMDTLRTIVKSIK